MSRKLSEQEELVLLALHETSINGSAKTCAKEYRPALRRMKAEGYVLKKTYWALSDKGEAAAKRYAKRFDAT